MPSDSPTNSIDAWGYHRLALNLDRGHGFSMRRTAPFVADSIRTPLYPIFLLIIRRVLGPEPRTAAIVQAFVEGCTTLLTWRLATQLGGHRAGRIAALLYALNPTQIRYTNELLTETLLTFLLTGCTYALVRYVQARQFATRARRIWIVGLLTGLSALCKPNVQFLPLVWLIVLAAAHWDQWQHALRDASVLIATTASILAPWVVRNDLVFGRPFLSTAFEGNISRVSAPAALAAQRDQYVAPWSAEWESLFTEIVTETASRYRWNKPWETLDARELDAHNHQVYLIAREILTRHPTAWLKSHLQGLLRYLEPRTSQVCYARFTGTPWPPDLLDDATIHVSRALWHGDWAQAGQIIAQERWNRLNALQGTIWWATMLGQVIGLGLTLRGAWRLRRHPALAIGLLLTIAYVLWVPGPIAYERFRTPAMGAILALIGTSSAPDTLSPAFASAESTCYNFDLLTVRQITKCTHLSSSKIWSKKQDAHCTHRTQRTTRTGSAAGIAPRSSVWHGSARTRHHQRGNDHPIHL